MNTRPANDVADSPRTTLPRLFSSFVNVVGVLAPPVDRWWRRRARADRDQAIVEHAAGNVTGAIAAMQDAIAKDRYNPDYYCDLGQIYYEAGDYNEATQCFRKALRFDYGSERAQKGLGYSLQALGEFDEAIYVYLRYLHQNEKDADAVLNLAVVLHNAGKYEEAVKYYTRCAELTGESPIISQNLGRALYSLGRMDEAFECAQRALEMDPTNPEGHWFLGYVWEAKGDSGNALKSYMMCIEQDPTNANVHLDISRLVRKEDKYREAVEHDLLAVKIFEDRKDTAGLAWANWELGWDYYKVGDWAHSIEASRKAVELNPAYYAARFNLALALLHEGRQKEALEEYRKGAADVELASELDQFALEDLREALQARPDLGGAHEILRELETRYEALKREHGLDGKAASTSSAAM
jgi:tetratricopeptide (TPR) repeat protein